MKTIGDISRHWLKRKPESLSEAESRVLQSAIDGRSIAANRIAEYEAKGSFGDRCADYIARIGGSWAFIIAFIGFLCCWALANVWLLGQNRFDPYPFVFLNLVLSMVAALQAPVIMMSQNRQAERDRLAAGHDYEVNLKAEIEIMALHEKFDALRDKEIARLCEQVSVLSDAVRSLSNAAR